MDGNLKAALLEMLPAPTVSKLLSLQSEADQQEVRTFLVGGVIRDLLLGRPTMDVDVVLEADALDFARHIAPSISAQVRGHEAFRTATLSFGDGFQLDLVTARSEKYPQPGSLPMVTQGNICDDLARRDFTINTLAMHLNAAHFGKILDRHSGVDDLARGVIRALHPQSFVDDPTRLFRAVRYAKRYGFDLDPLTAQWFHEAVAGDALDTVSGTRISHEFERIFAEPRRSEILHVLNHHRLLECVYPTWHLSEQDQSRLAHVDTVVSRCQELAIPYEAEVLCWMAMLADLGPESVRAIGQRLGLDAKLVQMCTELHLLLQQTSGWSDNTPPSTVYRYCKPISDVVIAFACWSGLVEQAALRLHLAEHRQTQPWITGDHLMQSGLPPGPEYTKILWQFLAAQLDGEIQTPEDALRQVREKVACQKQH